MKKIFIILFLLMVQVIQVQALTKEEYLAGGDYIGMKNTQFDPFYLHLVDYEALESDEIGTGSKFYLDSAISGATAGTSWATAVDTLKEAIALCANNNGDIIYVAQGHAETVTHASALIANKAGITIYGFGEGEDMPEISFITNATAELTISAADVTIYNIRFLSNYEGGLTAGIVIDGDGDGTRIIGCEFRETSDTYEMLIMINAAAAADELVIAGNRFIGVAGGSDTVAINLAGASSQSVIADNYFYGDWSDYVIKNGATSLSMLIENNTINNLDTGTGKLMSFSALSTGNVVGNKCYGNGATFAFVGAAMFVSPDNVFMQTEATAAVTRNFESMLGAYTGPVSGAAIDDNVKAATTLIKTDTAAIIEDFETYGLDELTSNDDRSASLAYPDSIVAESVFNFLMSKTLAVDTYDYTTDSLEMQHDIIGAYTGDLGANDDDSVKSDVDLLQTDVTSLIAAIVAMNDSGYVGTCTTNSSQTTAVVPLLAGFDNDYFNTGWSMICILRDTSAGTAPEGEIIDIINYVSNTGTFTVSENFSVALTDGDAVMVRRTEDLELDMPTALGSAGTIHYVDSGAAGDATGLTWENAYLTIHAAEAAVTTAGDVVYIADGHSESINTGGTDFDVANISWIGMGEGDARPVFIADASADDFTLDAAGITMKNFRMQPSATAETSAIRVEDAGIGCTIENVSFIIGVAADDEFVICIDVDAAADKLTVKDCTYYNTNATTAHTSCFVDLSEAAIQNTTITGCTLFGEFANGAIYWAAAIPLNLAITDNIISNTTAAKYCIYGTGAATGVLTDNRFYSNDYATMLDPGELFCSGNIGADDHDQQGIPVPISAETTDVTGVADGSNLERLEWLQDKSDDILAALGRDGTAENIFYVDATGGGASNTGQSWAEADSTLKKGIDHCTTDTGAIIFVAANHLETFVASQAVDNAGITIWGLGVGESRPQFIYTSADECLAHTVSDVMYKNCIFRAITVDPTAAVTLNASSDGTVFEDCEFRGDQAGIEFLSSITVASDCDDVRITRCKFDNVGGDNATAAITNIAGITDGMIVEDCEFRGVWSVGAISSDDADTGVIVRNNSVQNTETGVGAIVFSSAATGELSDNRCYGDTWGVIIDPGSLKCFNNYVSHEINENGYLFPAQRQKIDSVHGTGRVIYVDSGATAGGGGTWDTAFNTVDAAMDDCVADRGDTIYVAQGHHEKEAATGPIFTMDVEGVSVIGISNGTPSGVITTGDVAGTDSQMPVFVLDHVDAEVSITAANCRLQGIRIESDIADCKIGIVMSNASDGSVIEGCVLSDGAAGEELLVGIQVAADADAVRLLNNRLTTVVTGQCTIGIELVGGMDNGVIKGNRVNGTYATAVLKADDAASVNILIEDNVFITETAIASVLLNAATTGIFCDNYLGTGETMLNGLTGDTAIWCFENYISGTHGASGVITPAVDTD